MTSTPTTLYDFFTDSKFVASVEKFNCIQTAILRYYLTASTGKRLKNERLDSTTIKSQLQKLKKINIDSNFDIDVHLDLIKKGGEMYGKNKVKMKSHVSYGKRFFDFVKESVVPIEEEKKYDKNDILSYTEAIMDKSEWIGEKRVNNKRIILKKDPNFYLKELRIKYLDLSNKQLYDKAQYTLKTIFDQLAFFSEYSTTKKTTSRKTIDDILRFVGWYKEYNNLSIDELSIEKVFPISSPYIKYDETQEYSKETISEIAQKEWYRKQEIKYESKRFIETLKKYLKDYLKEATNTTKVKNIQSLISFTSFLYKDVTDPEENSRFQDISLINRLHVLTHDINKIKEAQEKKAVPFVWKEVELVCERLRLEAEQDYSYSNTTKNNKGPKLSKKSKAIHIQKFLAIAFFCVMPPDRQRTFRELTFGGTLKYGIRDVKRNTFTSYDKLKEGEEPKYYIHLLPHQYKTGDIYGTYWHEINNVKYVDGKRFYDYLNAWLFDGYRDELAHAEKTDAVFIRSRTGKSYKDHRQSGPENATLFGTFISSTFQCKTKFPLYPHALRNIYITHINNAGFPEDVKKAIAYMMHHSLDIANKTYNRQTLEEKIKLGEDYLKEISDSD